MCWHKMQLDAADVTRVCDALFDCGWESLRRVCTRLLKCDARRGSLFSLLLEESCLEGVSNSRLFIWSV